MKHTLLLWFLLLALPAAAQSDWEQVLQDWMVEDTDGDYGENTMEMLEEMVRHPISLNQVTREQLERLPFLSAQQIEDIVAYVYRYGPVRSIAELQMVTSLDRNVLRLLRNFLVVGDPVDKPATPTLADISRYGRHTLMATAKVPLYEREGDRNGYLGYKYRHDIRYQFAYRDRVKFGLTGAQDAGEPFLANKNTLGYDHYSYYFQLRDFGRLEELNVGMYRAQLGMGLLMNTGFHLGKVAALQSMGRSTHTLTAHSSRSAAGYLQGAAATVRLSPHWRLTALASYRPQDATLNDDGSVRTIVTDGYHRTPAEIGKKHNTYEADLGACLAYRRQDKTGAPYLNLNMLYTHFDRPLRPQQESSAYRRYAQEGYSFFNGSLDYGYTGSRVSFYGETALNDGGALAAIHVLSVRATEETSLMLLHRYYDKRYTAFHAYSFSEGTATQNEHGIYLGVSWTPSRSTSLQAYCDYAHFPWLRYRVSAPSDALDAMLLARTLFNTGTLEGRYRFHLRQHDNSDHTMLRNSYEHRARLRLTIGETASSPSATATRGTSSFSFRTQVDAAWLTSATDAPSRGIMVGQHVVWQYRWLQLNTHVGWFHTDDYDSRLYQYERSVRYDFSFPAFYGHGLRYGVMAAAAIAQHLSLSAKFSVTDYFDRSVISSGLQQINASSQPDLLLQLRYRF